MVITIAKAQPSGELKEEEDTMQYASKRVTKKGLTRAYGEKNYGVVVCARSGAPSWYYGG